MTNTNTWEMRYGGRELAKIQGRRKTPSFSSSLLDAIYNSIDISESKQQQQEAMVVEERKTENGTTAGLHGCGGGGGRRRRNHATTTTTTIQLEEEEEEIYSLRRAIMVDKWMENYPSGSNRRKTIDNYSTRRVNSDSSSSTDSSFFSSSSETESGSKSSASTSIAAVAPNRKHEGRFMTRTKSRALKIYGDLKKVKQPISPGGKIANFLNSIFNSNKKHQQQGMVLVEEEDWSSVRKSRSVNDSYSTRSCFVRQPAPVLSSSSTRTKSQTRSVRFCPVGVIVDEYSKACGHTSIIYDNDPSLSLTLTPIPSNSSSRHYNYQEEENNAKKKKKKKHKYREFEFEFFNHEDDDEDDDDDGNSCTSSDLFELENIGLIGMGTAGGEELPVYGTTNLKKNQAIIYCSSQKGCL